MAEQEEVYYIYMLENIANKRKYIGQTRKEPEQRWCNGRNYSHVPDLFDDINKYGWAKGFRRVILCTCSTKLESLNIESYFIKKYKTTDPKCGYNQKVIRRVNRKLIADIVKNCKSYEVPAIKKERKPIKLMESTINKIKNARVERVGRGKIITGFKTNYMGFIDEIDIGYEWYGLPHGIIGYQTYKNSEGKINSTLKSSIGHLWNFFEEPLTPPQIIDKLKEHNILEQIERYKDLVEKARYCEKFYSENEDELAPFRIDRVYVVHYLNRDEPYMGITFIAPITEKYMRKFLGMDQEYFEDHPIEVLQKLGEKGAYEKFLEFGDKLDWTL